MGSLAALIDSHVFRLDHADPGSLRRDARDRAIARMVMVRLLAAPVLATLMLSFVAFEPTPWRRYLLAGVATALLTISVVEFRRFRRRGVRALSVPLNLFAMGVGQLLFVFSTGGLFGPVAPALIPLVLVASAIVEQRTLAALLFGLEIPALFAMAWVHSTGVPIETLIPSMYGDTGDLERGFAPWVVATFYSLVMILGSRIGTGARRIYEELLAERIRENDRVLAMHAEQSRALTTLSAEIAHELKNPLASVKGLGALIAKDVSGKTEERLAVLRREVDRMQGTLDEFLNFSRPLVPLALEPTPIHVLARDVTALHEGTALARGVSLRVSGRAAGVECDPRKIRQVLINLIQNALDASPAGGEVVVRVDDEGERVRVSVLDHGAGVDADLAARVFDPGVTDKPRGSGLGLAVARSLARQHGGELTLENRPGGGASAELVLPKQVSRDRVESAA